jgi:formamidopyrimidine-DNA glycosylase
MPELPDLQVFSRNLNKVLRGKKLLKIKLPGIKSSLAANIKKSLEAQKLVKVYRDGKELRFAFQNKKILGIHLMLRGRLQWATFGTDLKHVLTELIFENKTLILTDYQRRARIFLDPPATKVPDALSKQVNEKFWKDTLQSKAGIKNLLLDQHQVRGIGNAYADEILWKAGISPFSVSNKIPASKIKMLARSVKAVLADAEKKIAKAEPGIIGGEIRDFLIIHNAKQKKSPSGAAIKKKSSGGRPTYFTNEQELFK